MKKFLVLYMAPVAMLDEWMKKDPEQRKAEEQQLQAKWQTWMQEHENMFSGMTAGIGKVKRIAPSGVIDTRNDLMMYSIVEAESHEAAAEAFKGHPHLEIPQSSIEIMPINPLPGMSETQPQS